jgi:hypothetical protein
VLLTVAYYRRKELLKLAPLGLVLLLVVINLSPGALGSVIDQFTRHDAATVPTVSDRASDYDAIRPDVWSHLALGRGYGSYNHDTYRILDSEVLLRTIETGVLGLAVFLLIADRDPDWAPVALVGAAIAVAFPVLAFLFDILSFPHVPYIFLYMIGLVAVVVARPRERRQPVLSPGGRTGPALPAARTRPVGVHDPLAS